MPPDPTWKPKRTCYAALRIVLLFTLTTSCDVGFIAGVTDRQSFRAPATYKEWWAETETCSQRSGDYSRIDWYTASGITSGTAVGRGRWSEPHDIIIVRGYENDAKVVRHEMLHDLL